MALIVRNIHREGDEVAIVFAGGIRAGRKHCLAGIHAIGQGETLFAACLHVVLDEPFKAKPTVGRNDAVNPLVLLACDERINHAELGDGVGERTFVHRAGLHV